MKNTIYCNDHNARTSTVTRIEDVPEVAGITYEEWTEKYGSDIEKLNADLYEFTFSAEPEYGSTSTKNTIKVNADTLENECGWEIADEDKGADLYITWGCPIHPGVRVYRHPEGGYLNEYSIDPEMFFSETLPALKESNEIIEEEYND